MARRSAPERVQPAVGDAADAIERLTRLIADAAASDPAQPIAPSVPRELRPLAEAIDRLCATVLQQTRQTTQAACRRAVADERDRISAGLNDIVVRRMFALGLSIQRLAVDDPDVGPPLQPLVEQTDEIIRGTRELLFCIEHAPDPSSAVRRSIQESLPA